MIFLFVVFLAASYAQMEKVSDFYFALWAISLVTYVLSTFQHFEWRKCRLSKNRIKEILEENEPRNQEESS